MSRRAAVAAALAAYLALIAVAGLRAHGDLVVPERPLLPRYGMQDFRDNFYYPSVALLQGRNPYDAADYRAHYPIDRPLPPYSPISLLVHLPLALLPFGAAEAVHFAAGALLLVVLARIALAGAGAPVTPARALGLAALTALSRPAQQTLYIGQCTIVVVLGVALALIEGRRRPWLAAVGLALTCLKPSYGLPLGLLMLCRGDWRAFLRGSALAAVAGAVGATGPAIAAGGVGPLVASVRAGTAIIASDPSFHESSSLIRIDVGGLVGRFLGRPPGAPAEIVAGALILGIAGWVLWRRDAGTSGGTRSWSDGLACLAILLSVYHQAYDALLLVVPIGALLAGGEGVAWPAGARRLRAILVVLLLVPWLNVIATHAVMNRLGVLSSVWLPIASANGAALLVALVLWLGWSFRPGTARAAP